VKQTTIIIPNLNGMRYLDGCLGSLRQQTDRDFDVILVDNASGDGSAAYVRAAYPEVCVVELSSNTGFCTAVNTGIRMAETPYVLLLNNDTVSGRHMVERLRGALEKDDGAFSCAAKMIRMSDPRTLDDAGDYYCALGWAFARGRGASSEKYAGTEPVFACCAAAAIYRRKMLEKIGLFDERHFAYLEDIDLGWRARRAGYRNLYVPSAKVLHAGSATSGSAHNDFKVSLSSRNSVFLIYKNMPLWMIALNAPLLAAGYIIKAVYFSRMKLGRTYLKGILDGFKMCAKAGKAARPEKSGSDGRIQLELWVNCLRRLTDF